MKAIYKLFFLFTFFSSYSFAQTPTIDSLQVLLKKDKADTNKVNHLNGIALECIDIGLHDTALYYCRKAFQLAEQLKYKKGIATAHNFMGHISFDKGELQGALKNYTVSLQIRKSIRDKIGISNSYNNVGNVYSYFGNYPEALKNYIASLKMAEELGDKECIANSYSNIAVVYHYQNNFSEALKYNFKSLKLEEERGNEKGIADSYSNIANNYVMLNNYEDALKYYFSSLSMRTKIGDQQGLATSYSGIGTVYYYQENYKEALTNHSAGLKIREEIEDSVKMITSYTVLGAIQIKLNKLKTAEEHLFKALKIANKTGYKSEITSIYSTLVELDSVRGDWRNAYLHHKLFMLYKDSLDNEETKKQIVQTAMTYEFEKKEASTKALQEKKDAIAAEQAKIKELELSRTRNYMYGLGGLLLLAFTIGILVVRQNKLQSMQRSMQLEQKLLRLQMNPHFIYNSLSIIHEHIQSNRTEIAGDYLIKFSRLMRLILENSRQEYVSLDKEIETLNNYLKIHQLVLKNGFDFTIHIDESIDQELIAVPPMLAQPFIENALKHGIAKGDKKGEIKISFEKSTNGILFSVIDNGIGYSNAQLLKQENNSTHNSLATQIVYERLENINKNKRKKIHIHISDSLQEDGQITGTKIEFEIPINYIA